MRRLLLGLVPLTLVMSACAVGTPTPTTYVSDRGATLNGTVASSFRGATQYWWRYGTTTEYGSETPHRSVDVQEDVPYPVSEPISGVTAATTYHFQMCVTDGEEEPPRTICNTDRTFTTAAAGGRSGIAYEFLNGNADIMVMDADGDNQVNVSDDAGVDEHPSWSPDGKRIVFVSDRGDGTDGDIWVMDADGGNPAPLTDDSSFEGEPAWSPDGSRIAFSTDRDGHRQVYVMNADGSDQVNLTQNAATAEHPTWSPDGGRIAYEQSGGAAQAGVWSMNADGSAQEIVAGTEGGSHPDWSPDGREIAFVASFGTVNRDLWAVPSTGGEARKVAALTEPGIPPSQHAGAEWPSWSPNGASLAFSGEPTYEIYSVAAAGGTPVNLTDNGTSSIDLFPSWSPRP